MKIHVETGEAKMMQDTGITEKTKRKGTPLNIRRYWQIFGLIAILLIIPFRVVPYWSAMIYTYLAISGLIALSILCFIWRYGFRKWLLILMLICMLLPIGQIMLMSYGEVMDFYNNDYCATEKHGVFTITSCTIPCTSLSSQYVGLFDLSINILAKPDFRPKGSLFVYCLF